MGLIPGSGRPPEGWHGNSPQYSCLENPMDRGLWQAAIHGIAKSWTQLKQLCLHTGNWGSMFRLRSFCCSGTSSLASVSGVAAATGHAMPSQGGDSVDTAHMAASEGIFHVRAACSARSPTQFAAHLRAFICRFVCFLSEIFSGSHGCSSRYHKQCTAGTSRVIFDDPSSAWCFSLQLGLWRLSTKVMLTLDFLILGMGRGIVIHKFLEPNPFSAVSWNIEWSQHVYHTLSTHTYTHTHPHLMYCMKPNTFFFLLPP